MTVANIFVLHCDYLETGTDKQRSCGPQKCNK